MQQPHNTVNTALIEQSREFAINLLSLAPTKIIKASGVEDELRKSSKATTLLETTAEQTSRAVNRVASIVNEMQQRADRSATSLAASLTILFTNGLKGFFKKTRKTILTNSEPRIPLKRCRIKIDHRSGHSK
ncbi:hypothetical protein HK096_009658 [Nowakowskiella sp. JEL0078]|nr:hypothetical protein HK096_009658 [Nowakowskiella sp. JEL0078]